MRWIVFVIFSYLALLLQTAVFPAVFPDHFRPWALVILANIYLLSRQNEWTILLVWIIGLLGDLNSLSPLGSQALAFGLFGMLILAIRPVLFVDSPLAHAVTSATGVIVISAIYTIEGAITSQCPALPFSTLEVVGQALATAIMAAVIKILMPAQKKAYRAR